MRDELQRWLDGDLDEAELPEELRADASRWQEWLDAREHSAPHAPGWVADAVMARIARIDRRGPLARLGAWLLRPWTVRIRPLTIGAVAAALAAAILFWPGGVSEAGPGSAVQPLPGLAGARDHDGRVYVQFVYAAGRASSVAVAGDFNEWSAAGSELRDPDGDGVWTGYVSVSPGLHKYMFVVDGQWVTDPHADRHVDDGFGHANALMTVLPPGSSI